MGLSKLNPPPMATKRRRRRRRRRRRQIGARDGSIALQAVTKGLPCRKHGEGSLEEHTWLSMDILLRIHSLMRFKDAARLACLSRDFARSWRYRDSLIFSEESLGFDKKMYRIDDKMRLFTSRVDKIMKAHKGIGVKTFKLDLGAIYNPKDFCHLDRIDRWLQIAVKPGIEELNLNLARMNINYNLPCSLFSGGTGDSLRCLDLSGCNFYPTVESCCLRSLTRLKLWAVHILEDNLRCLFSTTSALEWLELGNCSSLFCLEIPCLQQLSHLGVSFCTGLQLIENKAPNLSSFSFSGAGVQLSLGDTLHIKKFIWSGTNAAMYARTEVPSYMPNLETLTIVSENETLDTPMMPSRFLHLKFLSITLRGLSYDFCNLVSFIYTSPSLETFILSIPRDFTNPRVLRRIHGHHHKKRRLRRIRGHHHDKLKSVQIINFFSATSLVELTCYILQTATSLKCLTLDTTCGAPRCSVSKSGKCALMPRAALEEARSAVTAVQTYILPEAPSTVELNVLEPCSQCQAAEL
ncbi:hypothetical protein U9M48_043583 [Paspalum notatum var. saurae]|uniref:At1g61320/AtMIF1 LRR domain-containing protein n=1 Tax=Paspalum notatum var. saurae TaxID=547442 RepID=A0AAQ3UXH3_PASNO